MWNFKTIQWLTPFFILRNKRGESERFFSQKNNISRVTLRQTEGGSETVTVESLAKIAHGLDAELILLMHSKNNNFMSDFSTVSISMKVINDGFASWKLHFFELIDEYRKTLDPRLFILPPVSQLDQKLKSLLASIVLSLCEETEINSPLWARKTYYLEQPWFPSEFESLKASACLESPVWFRKNNIFVLSNFMQRA